MKVRYKRKYMGKYMLVTAPDLDDWYTVAELSEMVGIGLTGIYKRLNKGLSMHAVTEHQQRTRPRKPRAESSRRAREDHAEDKAIRDSGFPYLLKMPFDPLIAQIASEQRAAYMARLGVE